jgi:hypothetical protein
MARAAAEMGEHGVSLKDLHAASTVFLEILKTRRTNGLAQTSV